MRAGPDPTEDTDLDNPEFLFDAGSSKTSGTSDEVETHESIRSPSAGAPPDSEAAAFATSQQEEDPFERGFDGGMPGGRDLGAEEAEAPDSAPPGVEHAPEPEIPDIRAQKDELAAQRALAALNAADQDDTAEPAQEASFVTRNDDWSDMAEESQSTAATDADTGEFQGSSSGFASAAEGTSSDSTGVGSEGSDDPFADLASEMESVVESLPGRAAPSSGARASGTTSGSRSSSVVVRAAGDRRERMGLDAPAADLPNLVQRAGPIAACLVGALLALGGVRTAYERSLRIDSEAPRAQLDGSQVEQVIVRDLQDLRGRRVLVIAGRSTAQLLRAGLSLVLVDGRGRPVAEPVPAVERRLPAALSEADVTRLLQRSGRTRSAGGEAGSDPVDVAVLIPDPSPAAKGFTWSPGD